MRLVIQRVMEAAVEVQQEKISEIGAGLCILAGIENADTNEDAVWLAHKVLNMRIFEDANGVPNRSITENGGDLLVVSQFTLQARTKKGNRPSYIEASKGKFAEPLFNFFVLELEKASGKKVQKGIFGADMKVSLVNDGPFTIVMDSKQRDLF